MFDCYNLLKNIRDNLLNIAAQVAAYSWDDEYARRALRSAWGSEKSALAEALSTVSVAQLQTLSEDERRILCFHNWDETLVLIPLWAFNAVADGETLISINGSVKVKGRDEIDMDVRAGCIAWGFKRGK